MKLAYQLFLVPVSKKILFLPETTIQIVSRHHPSVRTMQPLTQIVRGRDNLTFSKVSDAATKAAEAAEATAAGAGDDRVHVLMNEYERYGGAIK